MGRFYLSQAREQRLSTYCEFRCVARDGSTLWIGQNVRLLADQGRIVGFHAVARDITALKQAEAARHTAHQFVEQIITNAGDGIVVYDHALRYVVWNPAMERLTGLSAAEVLGRSALELFPHLRSQGIDRLLERVLAGETVQTGDTPYQVSQTDRSGWTAATYTPHYDSRGTIDGVIGIIRDSTERKQMEDALAHQAWHDPLTGLPNRARFQAQLERILASADRPASHVAVLFVDLDNFKVINDSLGHQAGDALLVEVAGRLKACVRAGDTVARLGGDEFTVLLEAVDREAEATAAAERIAEALHAPIHVAGRDVFIGASIGVALSAPHDAHTDTLLRNVDLAMYQAKAAGKARFAIFDARLEAQALERLELETDLRLALERDEFRLHYQAIQSLANGRIAEVEALLRWERPGHGLVSPATFIPVAEETGLIIPIGQWVLKEACRQARSWQVQYPSHPPLVISVNLSGRQFQHPDLVADIQRAVQAANLDPRTLKLEVTESVAMQDAEATVGTLRALKALGIQLAIDDFGTGYSSLAYLKRFPVDTLKIDRSFVDGVGQDAQDTAIVKSVVALAKTLHLQVTGEGIETPAQAAQLRALGCDCGQGYLFARPVPAAGLSSRLALAADLGGRPARGSLPAAA